MTSARVEFFPDVLEEFFEELDFLWSQRESNVFSADWTVRDLAAIEARAEAHLEGLLLAGDDGVALVRPFLYGEESGAATAAAFVLLGGRRADLDADVVHALGGAPVPAREGIGIALRHEDVSRVVPDLRRLAEESDTVARSIVLEALAFHRLGPAPAWLADLLAADDPKVRIRAYGAAGRLGGPWSADILEEALDRPAPAARQAAIHASARLGLPDLADRLRRTAARAEIVCPEAIEFLGALGCREDLPLLSGLLDRPATRASAIAALGASGRVEAVPLLLDAMRDPAAAVAAGRAFVRITGARGIESTEPVPPPPGLPEDEIDFHESEFPPDPARARSFWERERPRFEPDRRAQHGYPLPTIPSPSDLEPLPLSVRRDVYFAARAVHFACIEDIELERRVKQPRLGP